MGLFDAIRSALFGSKERGENKEGQERPINLFVCNCEGKIELPQELNFGDDVRVTVHSHLCSEEGISQVEAAAQDGGRLVIAGCTPRIARKFFAQFDPELVNIREQVAFPGHSPEKMVHLIRGAVAKARASPGIPRRVFELKNRSALVIGAGVAGLEAARQIGQSDLRVYLVEELPFLGGTVAKLDRLYPAGTPNSHTLYPLVNEVVREKNVEIFTDAQVEQVEGQLGDYTVRVRVRESGITECTLCRKCEEVCPVTVDDDGLPRKAIYYVPTHPDSYTIDWEHCTRCGECAKVCEGINLEAGERTVELKVDAIVVATGLKPYDATQIKEYGYGRYDNVLTAIEFERKMANNLIDPQRVVIIHCAGSRSEDYLPYCSKVCCLIGLKEAKLIKDRKPEAQVYVCYMDMRSYGQTEYFYTSLRDLYGVTFVQGRPAEVFPRDGRLVVRTEDIGLGENLLIETDCVVLSTGFVPDRDLLEKLGIKADRDFPRYYCEAGLSVDANPRGVYFCGSALIPQPMGESITDARSVALNVVDLLRQGTIEVKTPVAQIDSKICGEENCQLCVITCPYGAVGLEPGDTGELEVMVNPSLCMGCGVCTASCGAGANQLAGFTDRELMAQLEGMVREGDIVCFLCRWSAYNAADKVGYDGLSYPESARIIEVPCTGRVDTQMILNAFGHGAKAVLVAGCYPDACHYVSGNLKARRRNTLADILIGQFGIDPQKLRIEWIGVQESRKLCTILNELDQL